MMLVLKHTCNRKHKEINESFRKFHLVIENLFVICYNYYVSEVVYMMMRSYRYYSADYQERGKNEPKKEPNRDPRLFFII